ncbi:unnamed protein product [Leptosia nina]|uniref:Carboxylic ester hydrolase n=1 Tax=Leptosia nina TaxID=320188 RepID=A0AAV1JGF4_9NEOP
MMGIIPLTIYLERQPVVNSPSGEFRGGYNVTRKGRQFETYRGIPYAEPPTGELRFQPPILILNYSSPVDSTEDGASCPRPTSPGYNVNEDCLVLNVYTPLKTERKKPLPVIVYIHAGGFYSLSGRSDIQGPHYLLDRDIVLVTFNYRLGTLGFLSTGDKLAPGNNGMKDQVAALKWVQRNIASFGGDPDCVTITGCSAGAASVMLHMISPMSKDLFHRAISMSGSPTRKISTPTNLNHLAVRQAKLVNCPTHSSQAIIDCLKTVPWRDLGNSLRGFFEFGFDPLTLWEVVVEPDFGQERFLPVDTIEAIRKNKMHPVPYIISVTQNEFFWKAFTVLNNETLLKKMNEEWSSIAPISFVLPRNNSTEATNRLREVYQLQTLRNDSETARHLGRLYADALESFNIYRLMKLMTIHSSKPVWTYEFRYIGNHTHYEDPMNKKPVGAAHHDDLIYLFPISYRFPPVGRDGDDAKLVDKMTAMWDPNNRGDTPELEDIHWPPTTPTEKTFLRVDKQFSLDKNLLEEEVEVWEELYPLNYN